MSLAIGSEPTTVQVTTFAGNRYNAIVAPDADSTIADYQMTPWVH